MKKIFKLDEALSQKKISSAAYNNIVRWLEAEKYSEFKEEIKDLINTEKWAELEESFSAVLAFGTGGRRGPVGIGSNKINKATLGETIQGLIDCLEPSPEIKQKGVVISFDTRLTSKVFADYAASIFCANGFNIYLFDGPRSTPELSFTVRHLNTELGIMITASHNPPQDNGIKIYFRNGAIMPEMGFKIMEAAQKVEKILKTSFIQAKESGKIKFIAKEIDDIYINAVVQESLNFKARSAKIIFSALHGTGTTNALATLQRAGFKNLFLVDEQMNPDGHFSTIKNQLPNPGEKESAELVIKKCKEMEADIGLFTDPDADRLGLVAKNSDEQYVFLTGNQIAALLGFYILDDLKKKRILKTNYFVAKTLVTTDLLDALAVDFKTKIYNNLLIGFKYITNLIGENENEKFLFGAEQSNGFLKGTYTHDKDAAVAALLIAEFASVLKEKNQTLIDALNNLYKKYGLYWEKEKSISLKEIKKGLKMDKLMAGLRKNPFKEINGKKVINVKDFFNEKSPLNSNLLVFYLSSDKKNRLTIRPSGTEPLLRIYSQIYQPISQNISDEDLEKEKIKAEQSTISLIKSTKDYLEKL